MLFNSVFVALVVLTTLLATAVHGVGVVLTRTEQGSVSGLYSPTEGISQFLGVPYARPPVGLYRWRPPFAAEPYQGIYNATHYGPACMQGKRQYINLNTSEDCLYLNIWSAANITSQGTSPRLLPVMVYVHGGSFIYNSGSMYDGSTLANMGQVVVVTINYRLGAFGFLALPGLQKESGTTGNYGMQDQREALKWIQRNIAAFGGDPNSITLFGESAGAVSACHHLVSPQSNGLFNRAILQSGFCAALTRDAAIQQTSEPLLIQLGCGSSKTVDLDCLRRVSAEQIVFAQSALEHPGTLVYLPWLPVIDGSELIKNPYDSLAQGDFQRMPVVIGTNANEYGIWLCTGGPSRLNLTQTAVVDYLSRVFPPLKLQEILQIYQFSSYEYPIQLAIDVMSDWFFTCPSQRIASAFSLRNSPTFVYDFALVPGFAPNAACVGAAHEFELPFMFPRIVTSVGYKFSPTEQLLSDIIMKSWAAFATSSNPSISLAKWIDKTIPATVLAAPVHYVTDFRHGRCSVFDS